MNDSKNLDRYYNHIATIYDATRSLPFKISQQVTDTVLQLVSATPKTTFLEIGIGTGIIGIPFVQRGYPYTGIDISAEMMAQIPPKLGSLPPNLTLIQSDASILNFADRTFDVVLMRHVIHLIPDWRSLLSEIRRVLKPNGFYLYCESPWTPHQTQFEQQWQNILRQQPGYQKPSFENSDRASQEQVIEWLRTEGAQVESLVAAEWQVEETVGDRLRIYETRDHGSCWSVPDGEFPQAMQAFRSWCQQHYGSEHAVMASTGTFSIVAAQFQSIA
jgi:ubiquinone/menaquinone biosynthesis C-methylase UbiE